MDLKKIINKLILPKKDKEELVNAINNGENNGKGSATLFLVDFYKIYDFEHDVLMDVSFIVIDNEEKAQSVLHVNLDKVINVDITSAKFLMRLEEDSNFVDQGITMYMEIPEGEVPHPIYENIKYMFGYFFNSYRIAFLFDKNDKFVHCIVSGNKPS